MNEIFCNRNDTTLIDREKFPYLRNLDADCVVDAESIIDKNRPPPLVVLCDCCTSCFPRRCVPNVDISENGQQETPTQIICG